MIHSGCERSTFLALLTAVALTALSALPCLAAVSFKPQVNYSSTGVGTIGVATGDFDEDGHPDLVLANRSSTFISVLRNQGNGTFAAAVHYTTNNGPYSVCAGDFDEDGHIDIAAANQLTNDISILFGDGLGAFAAAVNYAAGTTPQAIIAGDFDGDGHLDLATANWNSGAVSTVTVFLNQAPALGTFAPGVSYGVGWGPRSLAVADFDRDGDQDLAVGLYAAGSNANIAILRNGGNGNFTGPLVRSTGSSNTRSLVARDFNGDEWPDLASANQGGSNVSVLENKADGTLSFYSPVFFPAGMKPFSITAGDFSLDGISDLATGNDLSQDASVLVGNGVGDFSDLQNFPVGDGHNWVATADFNGDNMLDLAVTNIAGGTVSILINDTLGLSTGIPILSGPGGAALALLLALGGVRVMRRRQCRRAPSDATG